MELRAENIAVGYGRTPIVEKISFQVKTGQLIALIGLNGCGKSTILRSLAGLLPLCNGELWYNAERADHWSAAKRAQRMAVVTTGKIDTAHMTAFEVAAMGRYPYTGVFGHLGKEDLEIVENAMLQCGLNSLFTREFVTLSDGERQRVLIARALAQQTALIFMDEPTSYLDIRGKAEVFELLANLSQNHLIIFSTHEVNLATEVVSDFWLIDEFRNFKAISAKEADINQSVSQLFKSKL